MPSSIQLTFLVNVVQIPAVGQLQVSSSRVCSSTSPISIQLTGTPATVKAWEIRDAASNQAQKIAIQANRLELNGLTRSSYIRAEINTQGCGQIFTSESFIEVNPDLELQLSGQGICGGSNRIQASASGGQAPFTYRLIPGLLPSNATGLFDNLPAGTYSVEVQDAAGCTSFRTIELNQLIEPPTNVRVETRTSTSVLVQWNPIPGNRVRYEVRYRLVGELSWTPLPPTAEHFMLINGLQAGGFYEVEVAALCPKSDGNFNGTVLERIIATNRPRFATPNTGTCAEQPPTVPGGIYISQITTRSARVHWSSHNAMLNHQGYIVSFGLASINPNNWPQFVVCHPDTFFIINGLTPDQHYGVRVRANCTNCTTALQSTDRRSNWSHIVYFQTLSRRRNDDNQSLKHEDLKLYPNPTDGGFTVEVSCPIEDSQLEIWNFQGRCVWIGQGTPVSRGLFFEPNLSAGLYQVRLRYCDGVAHMPLVIY